jgi:hypothetical protein
MLILGFQYFPVLEYEFQYFFSHLPVQPSDEQLFRDAEDVQKQNELQNASAAASYQQLSGSFAVPVEVEGTMNNILSFFQLSSDVSEMKSFVVPTLHQVVQNQQEILRRQNELGQRFDEFFTVVRELARTQSQTVSDVQLIRRDTIKTTPNVIPSLYRTYGIEESLPIKNQADMIRMNNLLLNPPDSTFFHKLVSTIQYIYA